MTQRAIALAVIDLTYQAVVWLGHVIDLCARFTLARLGGEGPGGLAAAVVAVRAWLSHHLVDLLGRQAGPGVEDIRPWPWLRPLIPMEDDEDA